MNFLAKHYFDFQSFVNLPHTAVQLHKTPPSQAGCDPSAAWAPKSLHYAGKNQAAPAARANHNNVEHRTGSGSHRHGRPSKLEFRKWGERHGELRAEKIIHHTDAWIESLNPEGFKHFAEDEAEDDNFPAEYFPKFSQRPTLMDFQMLVILTVTPHLDFVTVTTKSVRFSITGSSKQQQNFSNLFVKVCLFDGNSLIEMRQSNVRGKSDGKLALHSPSLNRTTLSAGDSSARNRRPYGRGETLNEPPAVMVHQNHNGAVGGRAYGQNVENAIVGRGRLNRHHSLETLDDHYITTDISESFLLRLSAIRLPFCHLSIQLYNRSLKTEPIKATIEGSARISSKSKIVETLVGGCKIGPLGSGNRGQFHWRQMVKKHGVPVCMWHYITKPPSNHHQLVGGKKSDKVIVTVSPRPSTTNNTQSGYPRHHVSISDS